MVNSGFEFFGFEIWYDSGREVKNKGSKDVYRKAIDRICE
jgi:hypothetical protein